MTGVSSSPYFDALKNGAGIMLLQAGPVNALNRTSVVCCSEDCSTIVAGRDIYQGKVDGKPPSIKHFGKGMAGHFGKEIPRLFFKVWGLARLKPELEKHFKVKNDPYAQVKTSLFFSGTLGFCEMVIQPFDTWRTMLQAGLKSGKKIKASHQSVVAETTSSRARLSGQSVVSRLFTRAEASKGLLTGTWFRACLPPGQSVLGHLFAGAGANGLRQTGTWFGFSYTETGANFLLKKLTPSIDPDSDWGLALKSPVQATMFTSLVYLLERLKNELQYNPKIKEQAQRTGSSRYWTAFKSIRQTQGWPGFLRGGLAKTLSNTLLTLGALLVLRQGRRATKTEV